MFCKECGQQIADGSRFCSHCGSAQVANDPVPAVEAVPASNEPSFSRPPQGRGGAPKKSAGTNLGIILAGLLGIAVIGSLTSKTSTPSDDAQSPASVPGDNATAIEPSGDKPAEPATSWSYSTDVDKVRGGTSYFATTNSTNTVRQDPPYDSDTSMRITVRRMPSAGTDVVLTISSGQFMCPSYQGCSGTVRFDNGPAQRVRFNGPADNSSDAIFVVGAKSFVAKLKKAKRLVVEKTLYQAGEPQFEFDVSGLKWEH